jgi:hypothetical protein
MASTTAYKARVSLHRRCPQCGLLCTFYRGESLSAYPPLRDSHGHVHDPNPVLKIVECECGRSFVVSYVRGCPLRNCLRSRVQSYLLPETVVRPTDDELLRSVSCPNALVQFINVVHDSDDLP